MKKGEVVRTEMTTKLEEMITEKLEEPTKRVEVFESRNWIHHVNRNISSVIRFYSGPVMLTIRWLDHVDGMTHKHLTRQGLLMKLARQLAASS